MSDPNPLADLDDHQLQLIHSASESFEKQLRQGDTVSIEQGLEPFAAELKVALFCELLAIELQWRRSQSITLNRSDYQRRFPQWQTEINELFADDQTHARLGNTRSDLPSSQPMDRALKSAGVGARLGERYTLVELIGEGGMGSVYRAQQHEPVVREVAIKFIKGGLDTQAVTARFELERQALAKMDHPGIARIFDGGQASNGLPYFVMELVRGVPITRYCDKHCLDVDARLRLFVEICHAVQHAHAKGVIHRDLKPGNILVTDVDGVATPRVIDFGVAKAIEPNSLDPSLTQSTLIVGTPAYMSPEQADPGSGDIDTRTDVYALGIVLYELLTGSTPFHSTVPLHGPIHEVLRRIRNSDSPRPSAKVRLSESLSEIASHRNIEPAALEPKLRGELDWIALKAIEKDRSRRYATANALARDVERYLAGELVEAAPPSRSYRVKKFLKRYRIEVAAAGLLLVSLAAGTIGTTIGMWQARANAQATQDELLAKEAALASESRERRYAEAITEFVERDMLGLTSLEGRFSIDGGATTLNKESTLRDLLDRASLKLSQRTDLDPRAEARLNLIIGNSYFYLGAFPQAIDHLERSSQLATEIDGPDHRDSLQYGGWLAAASQANGETETAQLRIEDLLSRSQKLLGDDDLLTLWLKQLLAKNFRLMGEPDRAVILLEEVLASDTFRESNLENQRLIAMFDLALALSADDQVDRAIKLLEETLAAQTETLDENHPDRHASAEKLGELYCRTGQFQRALPLLEREWKWAQDHYGPQDHHSLYSMSRLVPAYRQLMMFDRAIPLAEELLEKTRAAFASDHPNVANAVTDLAMSYRAAGKHLLALPLFEEALRLRSEFQGAEHPATLAAMINLAAGLKGVGEIDRSHTLNEECLVIAIKVLGESHSNTITIKQNLAAGYWTRHQLDRSIPLFEEVLAAREAKFNRSHPETLMAIANLGVNYRDAGRLDEAVPLLEEVYAAVPNVPALSFTGLELLDAYRQANRDDEASQLLEVLVDHARSTQEANSRPLATKLVTIGTLLLRTGAADQAEALFREAFAIRQQLEPEGWLTFYSQGKLGQTLWKLERTAEAEPLLIAAMQGMEAHADSAPPNVAEQTADITRDLIELLIRLDRTEEAAKWQATLPASPMSP